MKTIENKSNIGRFDYVISASIGDDVNEATTKLAVRGLADLGFRATASAITSALVKAAVPCAEWSKAGKTFPAGPMTKDTPRGAVEYSEATAELIHVAAMAALDKLAMDEGLPECFFAMTGEHVSKVPEASKEAKEFYAKHKDNAKLRGIVGAEETAPEAEVVLAIGKWLAEKARIAKEAAKNELA